NSTTAYDLAIHTRIRVELDFNLPNSAQTASLGTAVNEGAFETILKNGLINYDTAKNWRSNQTAQGNQPTTAPSAIASPSSFLVYKVGVNADGIYKITCTDLSNAGISLASLDLSTIQIKNNGTEISLFV